MVGGASKHAHRAGKEEAILASHRGGFPPECQTVLYYQIRGPRLLRFGSLVPIFGWETRARIRKLNQTTQYSLDSVLEVYSTSQGSNCTCRSNSLSIRKAMEFESGKLYKIIISMLKPLVTTAPSIFKFILLFQAIVVKVVSMHMNISIPFKEVSLSIYKCYLKSLYTT